MENFEDLGLTLNLKPNMKTSHKGKAVRKEAEERIYSYRNNEESDSEQSDVSMESEEEKKVTKSGKPDLASLLGLKQVSEAKFEKTDKLLSEDDYKIMTKLVAKYKNDIKVRITSNSKSMVKDIKLNRWQWSKAQLRTKYEKY